MNTFDKALAHFLTAEWKSKSIFLAKKVRFLVFMIASQEKSGG